MTERAQREVATRGQIAAKQTIDAARIRSEQTIERESARSARLGRDRALDVDGARRASEPSPWHRESEAQNVAQAVADTARADAITAEEKVFTAREGEMAERKKAIGAGRGSRHRSPSATPCGRPARRARRRTRALTAAAAIRVQAEADADADKIKSMALRVSARVRSAAHDERRAQHALPEGVSARCMAHWSRRPRDQSANRCNRWSGSRASRSCTSTGWADRDNGDGHGFGGGGNFSDGLVISALRFAPRRHWSTSCCARSASKGDIQRLVGGASGARGAGCAPRLPRNSQRSESGWLRLRASSTPAPTRCGRASGDSQWHAAMASGDRRQSDRERKMQADRVGCSAPFPHQGRRHDLASGCWRLSDYDYSCVYEILESPMGARELRGHA